MQTIVKVLEKAVITSALLTSVVAIADEAEEGQVQSGTIEEVIVQGLSSLQQRLGESGSISVIDTRTVQDVAATHPSEVLNRVPGVWINRGSGQEHLTAIRSGVYTGSGACGEFALLEDGIPLRPQGFCNINNLFELNLEQAQAVEVWRGPASAPAAPAAGPHPRDPCSQCSRSTMTPPSTTSLVRGGVLGGAPRSAAWVQAFPRDDASLALGDAPLAV